ncbi:MAG TPA: sigma-70 domain-containing protein [Polyangiaceae bacterium]|jgi:uncharacterized protein YidB (DUF937 family)
MALPPRLVPVLETLLAASETAGALTLDQVGEAIGVIPVGFDEVEELFQALERAGRRVTGPEGARGVGNLQQVIPAAKALAQRLGRRPTITELASHTGLPEDDVRHALALGRTMGR